MARFGGLGVLPQDMDLETAERIVRHIKAADPRYDTALAVSPRATLRDVQGIIRKRAHDMVVVVDDVHADRHGVLQGREMLRVRRWGVWIDVTA